MTSKTQTASELTRPGGQVGAALTNWSNLFSSAVDGGRKEGGMHLWNNTLINTEILSMGKNKCTKDTNWHCTEMLRTLLENCQTEEKGWFLPLSWWRAGLWRRSSQCHGEWTNMPSDILLSAYIYAKSSVLTCDFSLFLHFTLNELNNRKSEVCRVILFYRLSSEKTDACLNF